MKSFLNDPSRGQFEMRKDLYGLKSKLTVGAFEVVPAKSKI